MAEMKLAEILTKHQREILDEWIREQTAPGAVRSSLIREGELRAQCEELVRLLTEAVREGEVADVGKPAYAPILEMLERVSQARSEQGFSPSETATFVLSLKRPLFARLRRELEKDAAAMFREIWAATELLDKLALRTTEAYQKRREQVIARQQAEMLELSTPVVKLWDGVLALPLIGTLDSNRTQIVMETLLQQIVETNSEVAIIDITGVPTVDTLVAQHLMKTVSAARLMGVECIISGVRPQIAQTIVHLGVALGEIPTKSTLAGAFKLALRRTGASVSRPAAERPSRPGDRE